MTIQTWAMIRDPVALTDVLGHVESTIARLVRGPLVDRFVVEGATSPLSDIVLGPYPIDVTQPHPWPFLTWPAPYLSVSFGNHAMVGLAVGYQPSDQDLGIRRELTEQQRRAHLEQTGFHAILDAAFYRSRPSFCLAALLACSIATLSRSRINDDDGRLKLGEMVDPKTVAAMLATHGGAGSFVELANRFCDVIGFRIG